MTAELPQSPNSSPDLQITIGGDLNDAAFGEQSTGSEGVIPFHNQNIADLLPPKEPSAASQIGKSVGFALGAALARAVIGGVLGVGRRGGRR